MSDDLKKRLEAAKAARAALQAKTTKSDSEVLAAEVEAEERALKEDTILAALVEEHGEKKLAKVDTDFGGIILLRSLPANYKRFADKGVEFKTVDVETLVRPCVRYPSLAEFDEIIKEQPGVLFACGNAIAHLAGVRKDALSGK